MKSLKTIIIAGAVLIVFIIASLVVTHLPSRSGDTTADSVSQEESSSAETAYIINRDWNGLPSFLRSARWMRTPAMPMPPKRWM